MIYPKHPGIYAIRHVESGKAYIGSAKNIYSRWRGHKSDLRKNRHHCRYLQNAWNKYGEAAFSFEVLEICLPNSVGLRHREETWLQRLGERLYNASLHAEASTGKPCPESHKAAMRIKMMGNKNGEGTHYHGKLTGSDVVNILYRFARGEDCKSIAAIHKVSAATVRRIGARKIWWRVEVPPEVEKACRVRIKARGEHVLGESCLKSKLNWDKVDEIRRRAASGEMIRVLADEFGVTYAAIRFIVIGRNWVRKPLKHPQLELPGQPAPQLPSPLLNRRKYPYTPRPGSKPRPARIALNCDTCGAEINLPPCRVRDYRHHYCGKECRREGARKRGKAMMADPLRRAHLAEINRGKKASAETRAKMSASQRRRSEAAGDHSVLF